jgi:hypothetical protein
MTRSLKALPVVVLATLSTMVACSSSKDDAPAGTSEDGPVVLNDHLVIVSADAAGDVTVQADRLVFPAATHAEIATRQPGDVLAGDRGAPGSGNKHGFLRKVKSITQDGGSIIVMTEPAALTDAVKEGKLAGILETPALGIAGPEVTTNGRGIHPLAGGGTTIKVLDYSGTKLFDVSGSVDLTTSPPKKLGYQAHATVTKGTLSFSPKFDIGADIHPDLSNLAGSVKEFHVVATGQLDADVELDVGLDLTGNPTGDDLAQFIAQKVFKSQSTTIAEYPIDLGHLKLGPLPIPVHANFKATLACDLDYGGGVGVAVGGKASAAVTAGFKYENGSLNPVFGHTESFEMVGPAWRMDAAVHVRCSVKPEFDLNLFDVASGEIWALPYVSLGADATCDQQKLTGTVAGEAQAGVSAAAHAKVDVFGLYKWEKACTLFDVQSPAAKVSGTFTLPGGTTTTCTSNPPVPSVHTPEPLPDSCFGGGTNGNPPGTTDAGADASACVATGSPPPQGWTCDAAKYGDCKCDCDCGGKDKDCKDGECSACTHDTCTLGTALGSSCTADGQNGACIAAICANDSYCCEFNWSASCVSHVTNGDFGCAKRACP